MMLQVRNLTVAYGNLKVVDGVSFVAGEGEWLMIAGPNGAGKSTVVNAVAGNAPCTGEIILGGRPVGAMRPKERARAMGLLSQNSFAGYPFSVSEVVRMGRYAWRTGLLSGDGAADGAAVEEALELCGLTALKDRAVTTLSGGELQRTFLAQLFAQSPRLLILDEPTNHLDLIYQQQVFSLLRGWLGQGGRSVVSVVHDLSLARRYGDRALLMKGGRIVADGPPAESLSAENLKQVYSMDVFSWMHSLLSVWDEPCAAEHENGAEE